MNKLQLTIIDLIKEIDQICRKYDITYYASGGTVIGAFRHEGFIPWDDDADLYMTRENYRKFLKAFHEEKPKGRTFGTIEEDINYPGTITHYRNDENTTFITRYHILNSCDAGVVVDIFILDPVSDNPKHWDDHIGKLKIYSDINFPFYGYTNCGNTEYIPMYSEYEKKLKKYGKAAVNAELEKKLFSYPEEKATHYILRWGTLPHVFPKEMFGEPVYVDYEGIKIPMPTLWYDYLVQLYGYNWNEIPPNIQDEGHVAVISTEHRYTNYLIDVDRFIDKKASLEMYYKRKSLLIKREMLRRPFVEKFLKDKIKYVLYCQNKYLKENNIDVHELYQNKQYKKIIDSYSIYFKNQFNQFYVGKMTHNLFYRLKNPIFIPLNDDELEIVMYSLYYLSDFNKLNKLLQLRNKLEDPKAYLNDLQDKLNKAHKIMSCYYCKNYDEVYNLFKSSSEEFIYSSDRLTRIYYSVLLKLNKKLSNEEVVFLENKNNEENHCEWLKIYGDYLYSLNLPNYKTYYQRCLQLTNDGFIINELKKIHHLKEVKKVKKAHSPQLDIFEKEEINLLDEFVNVLDENNIDYYLIGKTLELAYFEHTLVKNHVPIEIAIKSEDAEKIMQLFKEDSKFVTPLDDITIAQHGFIYKSLDKCYLQLSNQGELNEKPVYLKISILRKNSLNVLERKMFNALNLMYKASFMHLSLFYRVPIQVFFTIFPKKFMRKVIFNNYLRMSLNSQGDKYKIGKSNVDTKYFDEITHLQVQNRTYKSPGNLDSYLENSKFKRSILSKTYSDSMYLLDDMNLKLSEVKDFFNIDKEIIDKHLHAFEITVKLAPYNIKAKKNWNIILRAEDRFNLFLEYQSKKSKIIKLYNENNLDEVWKLLEKYDTLARGYLSMNLGLCFDSDILNIYLDLLRKKDKGKIADKLSRLVPKEHLEDIEILDLPSEKN